MMIEILTNNLTSLWGMFVLFTIFRVGNIWVAGKIQNLNQKQQQRHNVADVFFGWGQRISVVLAVVATLLYLAN